MKVEGKQKDTTIPPSQTKRLFHLDPPTHPQPNPPTHPATHFDKGIRDHPLHVGGRVSRPL